MNRTESAIEILDAEGAYCGQCLREPGDPLDACRDCAAVLETYANALEAAGLLMPDLPKPHEVEFPGFAIFNLPGAGCSIPLDDYAPQVMVIFGDEECSDATTGAGDRLTAIKPEDLDKLIACLLAAREYAKKEHGNE